MKKFKVASLLLSSSIILAACGGSDEAENGSASTNEGKTFTLTVNNFEPAGANIDANILSKWEALVEEKTEGRVDVDLQHGGVLGPPTTLHQDLEAGLFDVSYVIANYTYDTKFFPYSIGTLPFAAPDSEKAAELLTAFAEKVIEVDTEFPKLKVYEPTTSDGYDLVSADPIDLKDFKGTKMRASTASESEFVQAIGGAPVALKINEAYEGLQKGTVDMSFVSPTQMEAYRTYEVAPNITRINFTFTPLIPAMNKSYFDKLPEDLQTLFDEELMPALADLTVEGFTKATTESYERIEAAVEGKGTITTPTEAELADLKVASKVSWESWIKDANDRGYNGQELVDIYFSLLEEHGIAKPF